MFLELLSPIDNFIDGMSMYRLLLYYLVGLILAAVGLSAAGDMHYSAFQIGLSAGIAVLACWVINKAFAYFFSAPVNPESSILTGLILALIIPPTLNNFGLFFILAASGLAIASKYILTIGEKHIFNPAAIAVVLTAFGPRQNASWWVGTSVMLPFVLIGGVLIMRKVRREYMVFTFLLVTAITTAIFSIAGHTSVTSALQNMTTSSPAFFLAFVMLTEPYSSPTTKRKQIWYAAIVGFLIAPQVHLGRFYTSPEFGIILGNIFAYFVSNKTKLFPILRNKVQIATNTFEFDFIPGKKLAFEPGQYMEFTLPHPNADDRGSRRWFTIASSPTEDMLKVGVKFYEKSSSYKKAMLAMNNRTPIVAAQVAGDFTMPKDESKKLVFIAGGIGVTPFRSMVKYMIDKQQQRPARMIYAARTEADLAYTEVFELARQTINLNTIYIVEERPTKESPFFKVGRIDRGLITQLIPDYIDCTFFISGTHPMVESLQLALADLGVKSNNIKVDFFPGYA